MDFDTPGVRSQLELRIKTAIDDQSAADNPPKHSWRISPSSLGDECVARQWYKFRWATLKAFDGRMSRLFNRGHKEEGKLVKLLRATGWEVRDYRQRLCYDEAADKYHLLEWDTPVTSVKDVHDDDFHIETAKARKVDLRQWRVKDYGGHLSGWLDGIGRHPIFTNNQWILLEFKTYNTKRFSALANKRSVQLADIKYYSQAILYLHKFEPYKLAWCLFLATNKNDDDIYPEIIPPNEARALDLLKTAHTILTSKARPARLGQSEAYFACKICDYVDVCHRGQQLLVSCRSCQHIEPIDGGKFHCSKWGADIPDEVAIKSACLAHLPVK